MKMTTAASAGGCDLESSARLKNNAPTLLVVAVVVMRVFSFCAIVQTIPERRSATKHRLPMNKQYLGPLGTDADTDTPVSK